MSLWIAVRLPRGVCQVCKAHNLTAIYEPFVQTLFDPQHLTNL
jgi:hypothetical protein